MLRRLVASEGAIEPLERELLDPEVESGFFDKFDVTSWRIWNQQMDRRTVSPIGPLAILQ